LTEGLKGWDGSKAKDDFRSVFYRRKKRLANGVRLLALIGDK
jgi:hypothetical protein